MGTGPGADTWAFTCSDSFRSGKVQVITQGRAGQGEPWEHPGPAMKLRLQGLGPSLLLLVTPGRNEGVRADGGELERVGCGEVGSRPRQQRGPFREPDECSSA